MPPVTSTRLVSAPDTPGTVGGRPAPGHAFKGITHRYLSSLAAVDPRVPGLASLLAADAAALWTLARDPASGGFAVDWGGPPSAPSFAADCAAATALALDAARVHDPVPVARAAAPR